MGAGTSPAGIAQAGYPDVATGTDPTDQDLFFDRSINAAANANKINFTTFDYELDANGRPYGSSSKSTKVLLALLTEKGSTPDPNYGMAKHPPIINEFTLPIVEQNAREALAFMVTAKEIAINSITAESASSGRILLSVDWRDLSTYAGILTRLEV
jgi:hypothetical protein